MQILHITLSKYKPTINLKLERIDIVNIKDFLKPAI